LTQSSRPAVSCENVTIALGGRTVLSGVDFAIQQGEFIGMLGSNGSGKTTLMRAILGLVPVQTGTVSVLGQPATRGNPAIGYMPQARGNLANIRFTGWDCVASAAGGNRWGLPRLSADERRNVDWALDMVGARDLARRPLAEMSGGERQRLLLSQALLDHPRLLLLDEPLINLDPTRQSGVVEIVRRLQKELGLAVVFSAHELNPLLGAIDRVLYLGGAKVVLGAVDEVITGPVLSRLYGSEIEVIRLGGRIFVMAGAFDLENDAHRHDHGDSHLGDHAHDHAGSDNVRL
jgi:zinc/manganese transport system ATP-binding protein